MTAILATTPDDVIQAIRSSARLAPHGARTKQPLIDHGTDVQLLDVTRLDGILEYDPAEFTFSALAGTRLATIEALLAEHLQYMPFDPPFVDAGATIGGTIAAGVNGSNRLRAGGLRDFIIGVRFVDGTGALVRGGGRVVKNAAGFDLPRLLVGSAGRLGVIIDATFKVFPLPPVRLTLRVRCHDLHDALARQADIARQPFELEALDLEPPYTLVLRVGGGDAAAVRRHAERVGAVADRPFEFIQDEADARYWREQREFAWLPQEAWLVRVPLQPLRIAQLDARLERAGIMRRYAVAGNVAWLAVPEARIDPTSWLDGLVAQVVRQPASQPAMPAAKPAPSNAFARRVYAALDPKGRLSGLETRA